MFSPHIERALRVALDAHGQQARKGDGSVPYVVHPVHAALILARLGAADDTIQAGILHDVVEDCADWSLERIEDQFGPRVREIVAELTEDKSLGWVDRKRASVERVPSMTREAALVKAADKLHNLSTMLLDLRAADHPDQVWRHFSRGPEETLAMSRQLVEALVRRVDRGLGRALEQALVSLEQGCSR